VDPVDEPAALDPADPGAEAAVPAPSDALEAAPGRDDMNPDIANDELHPVAADAAPPAAPGGPDPAAAEAPFAGRPLTDAEIDALPPEDDEPGG
jgi:hypothetical protein